MTTTCREMEEAGLMARRRGENRPISMLSAIWDGHRSVRVLVAGADKGLATTAYSYALTDAEKIDAAARIAALWTLAAAQGWSTSEIHEMAAQAAASN